jgi:hypothetical protein
MARMKQRGPSAFTVTDGYGDVLSDLAHFETHNEARDFVSAEGLDQWEIWQGDHIVDDWTCYGTDLPLEPDVDSAVL